MTVVIDRTAGRTMNLTYHHRPYLLIQRTRTWEIPRGKLDDPSAMAVERSISPLSCGYEARTANRWAQGTIVYMGPNNTESIFGTVVTADYTYYWSSLAPGMVSSYAGPLSWDMKMQDLSKLPLETFKKSRTPRQSAGSTKSTDVNILGFEALQESHTEEVPGGTATVWTVYVPALDYLLVARGGSAQDKNGWLTMSDETSPVVLSASVPEKFVVLPPAGAAEVPPSGIEKAVAAASPPRECPITAIRARSTLPWNGLPSAWFHSRHSFRCSSSSQPRTACSFGGLCSSRLFRKFSSTEAVMKPRLASSSPG
jgi:hypothetical protein